MTDQENIKSHTEPAVKGIEDDIKTEYYLLIRMNDERYFVELPLVSKIINPLDIFPLPDTLDFIAGVSNFSGEIVPMVDLKKVLKLPDTGPSPGRRFIICRYRDIKVGFIIDHVVDSWEIDTTQIKTDTTRVLENEFISGEYIRDKDVIGVIDIVKFIDNNKAAV
ncbi:MAG: hypothetical protein GY765_24835 [bacterium]|nr:hypothetical protein [bacterium]